MSRPRLPVTQKRKKFSVTLAPDMFEWLEDRASERGLDRSGAVEWLLVAMRYAIQEIGIELFGVVADRSAEVSGLKLGAACKTELQRQAQHSARVVSHLPSPSRRK